MKRTLLLFGLAVSLASSALAQKVDETRSADPRGRIQIENPSGRLTIVGWDRDEIHVTGTLAQGARLDFDITAGQAAIEVDGEGHHHDSSRGSVLEVHVPKASRLDIDGAINTSIDVQGVEGRVSAETVNGNISVVGAATEVDVETVNGQVEVRGGPRRVRAESVNGDVLVEGASGDVEASTVNGALEIRGDSFERVRLEVVNGRVAFEGGLSSSAILEIEGVGGDIDLTVPGDVPADFSISSFNGDIDNAFGQKAERVSRWTEEKELSFSNGGGGAKVEIHTLNGNVRISKK